MFNASLLSLQSLGLFLETTGLSLRTSVPCSALLEVHGVFEDSKSVAQVKVLKGLETGDEAERLYLVPYHVDFNLEALGRHQRCQNLRVRFQRSVK